MDFLDTKTEKSLPKSTRSCILNFKKMKLLTFLLCLLM